MAESPPGNPFPGSSVAGQATGSEMQIDGMEVAKRMIAATEAAVTAAQAASRAAEAASSRSSDGDGKQWWKLLPKPPRGSEISAWKEWSWLLEQYMASVDAKFGDDIQQVRARVDKPVDTFDFSDVEHLRTASVTVFCPLWSDNAHSWCEAGQQFEWFGGI